MRVDVGGGRGWLEDAPARSLARIDRRIGHLLDINEAGRTWEQQNAHYQRYLRYLNGGPWAPIALKPGTSLHERGYAIDTDEQITWLLNEHGWFHTVYRNGKLVEPWHYEYFADRDRHQTATPAQTGAPKPEILQEDDMAYPIKLNDQHLILMGLDFIHHFPGLGDPEHFATPDWVRNVVATNDAWIGVNNEQLNLLLDSFNIPRDKVRWSRDRFEVFDPEAGDYGVGQSWSRGREAVAEARRAARGQVRSAGSVAGDEAAWLFQRPGGGVVHIKTVGDVELLQRYVAGDRRFFEAEWGVLNHYLVAAPLFGGSSLPAAEAPGKA